MWLERFTTDFWLFFLCSIPFSCWIISFFVLLTLIFIFSPTFLLALGSPKTILFFSGCLIFFVFPLLFFFSPWKGNTFVDPTFKERWNQLGQRQKQVKKNKNGKIIIRKERKKSPFCRKLENVPFCLKAERRHVLSLSSQNRNRANTSSSHLKIEIGLILLPSFLKIGSAADAHRLRLPRPRQRNHAGSAPVEHARNSRKSSSW